MIRQIGAADPGQLVYVENFFEELKAKVGNWPQHAASGANLKNMLRVHKQPYIDPHGAPYGGAAGLAQTRSISRNRGLL